MTKNQKDKTLAKGIRKDVAIRYILVVLLGFFGFAVSLGSYQFLRNLEQTEARSALEDRIHDYVDSIDQSLAVQQEGSSGVQFTYKFDHRLVEIRGINWLSNKSITTGLVRLVSISCGIVGRESQHRCRIGLGVFSNIAGRLKPGNVGHIYVYQN